VDQGIKEGTLAICQGKIDIYFFNSKIHSIWILSRKPLISKKSLKAFWVIEPSIWLN